MHVMETFGESPDIKFHETLLRDSHVKSTIRSDMDPNAPRDHTRKSTSISLAVSAVFCRLL
jgi:hypothetical protein